ncbi:terminase [bacterium]|jgi:hypothetical protein|nr:terminase [Candidatus Elulimicrobium humile]
MTKLDDKLSETFKTETVEVVPQPFKKESSYENITDSKTKVNNDFNTSRSNLHNLLERGEEALIHALEIAKQSEHPRAFEVVGNMIKQLADVNQQLMDLHNQQKKIEEPTSSSGKQITNNSIFVGSTAELNKIIGKYKQDGE